MLSALVVFLPARAVLRLLPWNVAMTRHFAGLALDRPLIMGIVNVTPDSFSDGGQFGGSSAAAIEHGLELAEQGASILDVGGESTRPGAEPVSLREELARVLPVVEALAKAGHCVSIDTRHAEVMRQAVAAGAAIINDVTALQGAGSLEAAGDLQRPVILMHMQGEPQTMQKAPRYDDVVGEVAAFLKTRAEACLGVGLNADQICLDPGIGFGKTLAHNLSLLKHTSELLALGYPLLIGASRKSFICKLDRDVAADQREAGTIAAHLAALQAGAQIFRVHDVAAARQGFAVWQAVQSAD